MVDTTTKKTEDLKEVHTNKESKNNDKENGPEIKEKIQNSKSNNEKEKVSKQNENEVNSQTLEKNNQKIEKNKNNNENKKENKKEDEEDTKKNNSSTDKKNEENRVSSSSKSSEDQSLEKKKENVDKKKEDSDEKDNKDSKEKNNKDNTTTTSSSSSTTKDNENKDNNNSNKEEKKKIDREKTCPFLIRISYKNGNHHRLEEFDNGRFPSDGEMQIYTWRDASLREIVNLLIEANPSFFGTYGSSISLKSIYLDAIRSRYASRDLGIVYVSQSSAIDTTTLEDCRFVIGDYLDVTVQSAEDRGSSNMWFGKKNNSSMNSRMNGRNSMDDRKRKDRMDMNDRRFRYNNSSRGFGYHDDKRSRMMQQRR